MPRVLITGGTGLIGQELTQLLLQNDYDVAFLTRNANTPHNVPSFECNYQTGQFDTKALAYAEHVIHLAGAGVAEKRWSESRKSVILDSRVKTAELLIMQLNTHGVIPKTFVTASGIAYYGTVTQLNSFTEDSPAATDYLADVCAQWEGVLKKLPPKTKTAALRTGVVFSESGGALEKMIQPIKFGVGAPLGSGLQMVSWVHIADLCQMYLNTLTHEAYVGPINATAPNAISNKELTRLLAEQLNRPLLLPNVPAFVLKIMLGEMSGIVLQGTTCSPKRLKELNFDFQYPTAKDALKQLWKK